METKKKPKKTQDVSSKYKDPDYMAKKIEKMRIEKQKQEMFRKNFARNVFYAGLFIVGIVVLVCLIIGVINQLKRTKKEKKEDTTTTTEQMTYAFSPVTEEEEPLNYEINEHGKVQVGDKEFWPGYVVTKDDNAVCFSLEDDTVVASQAAVLINAYTGEVVAKKNDINARIVPASMTKVLTILVAAELIDNFDDNRAGNYDAEVIVTEEATAFSYQNDCSSVGYEIGEKTTVRDLFYGTILPSGGDAAYMLAVYSAGSYDAFVDKMNEKLKELGLSETTHFTNPVGLYDENHYSTCNDIAMIMKAALENDFCRQVMTEHIYVTSKTEEHEEGIELSNWFLRRIEDKDTAGEVICAKTGFVNESGSCAVSYEISNHGTPYICVSANAFSSWRAIYDHVALYRDYTDGVPTEEEEYTLPEDESTIE